MGDCGNSSYRLLRSNLVKLGALAGMLLTSLALPVRSHAGERPRVTRTVASAAFARGPDPSAAAWDDRAPASSPIRQWTDNHCGSCHQTDPLFSHPIDVVPSMQIPESMPLKNGRLTCVTCHDDRVEAHASARISGTFLLRDGSATIQGFCGRCHDRTDNRREAQHGAMLGRAHFGWPNKRIRETELGDFGIDAQSQRCLSCHDGLMSADIAITRTRGADAMSEHPIGVSMRAPRAEGSGPVIDLRSPAALDGRIRLIDDKVGCLSCHSPFSAEPKLLVMSNDRSRLCLSCHER